MKTSLTQKQADVLAVVSAFRAIKGYPPTLLELALSLEPPITQMAARGHILALERKGYITRRPGVARSIVETNGRSNREKSKRGVRKSRKRTPH